MALVQITIPPPPTEVLPPAPRRLGSGLIDGIRSATRPFTSTASADTIMPFTKAARDQNRSSLSAEGSPISKTPTPTSWYRRPSLTARQSSENGSRNSQEHLKVHRLARLLSGTSNARSAPVDIPSADKTFKRSVTLNNGESDRSNGTSPPSASGRLQFRRSRAASLDVSSPEAHAIGELHRAGSSGRSRQSPSSPGSSNALKLVQTTPNSPIDSSGPSHMRASTSGFRSWWSTHLPFTFGLASNTHSAPQPEAEPPQQPVPPRLIGPRRGEVKCLLYNSVDDLKRMEALSDHRPVCAVFAVGTV